MENLEHGHNYREWLRHEFARRKERNSAYSLRAFARDLGLQPPRLSEILKGNEGLSVKTATSIAKKLKLRPKTKSFWVNLVQAETARTELERSLARKKIDELQIEKNRSLSLDEFALISDWEHSAILELLQLKSFQPSIPWIARSLGLSEGRAQAALDRMIQRGLIQIGRDGKWKARPEALTVGDDVPSVAVRKFHRQVIEKSLVSLLHDPAEKREMTSMIFAIPSSKLKELRSQIHQLFLRMSESVQEDEKDELYAFSAQLFPISKDVK